jgi:two-component system response regulator AtoC
MRAEEFRQDLYYRLNVVEIQVPPLRERPETIPVLISIFLERFNEQYHRAVELPAETRRLFMAHTWPGNIRELENTVRRLVVLGDPRRIHEELQARVAAGPERTHPEGDHADPARSAAVDGSVDLKAIARKAARDAERQALLQVLERVRWNRAEAARVLRVSYKTLLSKLTECGITRARSGPPRGG